MNDQFNYKEIAEEQCNRRYHTEMWKNERVQVLKERAELLAENKRLRAALTAWRHADWCESDEGAHIPIEVHEARRLTDAALEQKP